MRIYVGFDDTDNITAKRGTGKLARWFEKELPEGCRMWGAVRQQLLVDDRIPYTSHNSSACVVIETPDPSQVEEVISRGVGHLERHALEGSDPGLCVIREDDPAFNRVIEFGMACTRRVVTQKEALEATRGVHLSGHGGTNDGIIGAAAGVGLTASGWCGRFIEFGRLRDFPDMLRVSHIEEHDIQVVSTDRDARVPSPEDLVLTKGWVRPMLWGNRPVLVLNLREPGLWESLGAKRGRSHGMEKTSLPA